MKKIIALGGGEIGRPGFPVETTKIDREIIKLTGKRKPKLLFLPTASSDSELYVNVVKKHFGKRLGCAVDVLFLLKKRYRKIEIENKILESDIVYVGGGNTLKMMNTWRKLGVDKLLKKAARKGIVLSGVSAGAICWFSFGTSDARKFSHKKAPMIRVRGLGLVEALFCPHYHFEKERKRALRRIMKSTSGVGIALENCSAIEILDNSYRIITSRKDANAYKVFWRQGKYWEKKIAKRKDLIPLRGLLTKER